MLPLFLDKLVAIHLIHFKFVGFEDMQHILQLNMGLSVVERLKTYDVEKVVSTFLFVFNLILSDVAKPATWTRCANIHNFNRYRIGPVSRQNRRLPSFSVGSVHWLMCRVL